VRDPSIEQIIAGNKNTFCCSYFSNGQKRSNKTPRQQGKRYVETAEPWRLFQGHADDFLDFVFELAEEADAAGQGF
jgi:hypothetical protein